MKNIIDFSFAFFGLILLSPIFILVGILIYFKVGSPIIFAQNRPGLRGKIFKMYKFRSMSNATDADGNLLPDDQRLTSFGKTLRATSLDELPALWNVLKGDISIIGPRPLLVEYLPLYSKEQARRHDVKPGISGWAQVNGRNAIGWDEKFKFDVWYVDNQSLMLDIKIFFMTFKKVFVKEGIAHDGDVTMPSFKGAESKSGKIK